MPYPRAHWWVLFVIGVILLGFWPSYWSPIMTVPWQFHAHGIAASIWVLIVFSQSWTAHHKRFALHRATGRASLFLFPFLVMGLFAIIDVTAKNYAAGDATATPVTMLYGPEFLIGLVVAVAAYVTLYFRALKYRRKVWVHSGYMLGTPAILFESPFSRVMIGFLPMFAIRGPQDFGNILSSILWADALVLAFCLILWWRHRDRSNAFLVTGGFVALQMVTMGMMGDVQWLDTALRVLGATSTPLLLATGFALGAATSWAGWNAGKRPVAKVGGGAQPAAA